MTNDEIEGTTETRDDIEGTPLILAVAVDEPGPHMVRDMIDSGLRGELFPDFGFIVPFKDWTTAEECLRILRGDVKRAVARR